jgi:preprotein translocase subunit SecY
MLSAFVNSIKIPELRNRILFTLGLIFACRFVANVPTPGVDAVALEGLVRSQSGAGGGLFGLADLFSGGALRRFSIGALGIMPYISASIILQLMTAAVPGLERLAREGEVGRQKITQYTRYLTLAICAVQSLAVAKLALNPSLLFGSTVAGTSLVTASMTGTGFILMTILALTVGTTFIMWLGEQITNRGIGNGISVIITVNIVSRLPQALVVLYKMVKKVEGYSQINIFAFVGLIVMLLLVIAATVAVTQAQRKIPIHTTKRVVGRKVYGGQNTFMPLRINYSGVMPIIFASAILMFPRLLSGLDNEWCRRIGRAFDPGALTYLIAYGLMILFFSYFWVATQFNPIQIADDLKKQGGYVPGIRPGRPTAEFLDRTMTRLTLAGALFLTGIAVLPMILSNYFKINFIVAQFFGGTSMLIIVGVMLDTMRQVESHLLMRHYDGFLRKGRLRGRR